MDSICFQVWSIKKKGKHGKYSVEVSSGKCNTWVQDEFADVRINCFIESSTRRDLNFFALLSPVDTRTKNVRTKDVHIWFNLETWKDVPIWTSYERSNVERLKDVFFRFLIFFSLTHLRTKTTKINTSQSGFGKA